MAAATWIGEIDWNNDLDFADTGEVVTSRALSRVGLSMVRGRDTIRMLAPPAAGSCDFALNNQGRDYSPENAGGPLYGNLLPGRAVRWRATRHDYRTTVDADNPIAHWRLDDLTGAVAVDAEATSHGSYQSGTTLAQAGLVADGYAVDFNGTSGYASVPHVAALSPTAATSVEAWVVLDTLPASNAVIWSNTPFANYLAVTSTGASFSLNISGTQRTVASTGFTPATGTRYHLVGTYDGTNLRLYLNGSLNNTSASFPGSIGYSATARQIGRYSGTGGSEFYTDGRIDEVAVYGAALSGTRVAAHYAAGLGTGGDTATYAVWRGNLDDLPQEPHLRGGFVRAPSLGTLARLRGTKVTTALSQQVRTDQALATLFAAAGLAASDYTMLDQGKTILTAWWCADDDAFDMAARILAAEGPGAAIYEQGDGKIAFHSRHYRLLTARCTTPQVRFGNGSVEPRHAPPFGYQPNLKGVVNACTIEQKALTLAGSPTVLATWTPPAPFVWYPFETRVIPFRLSEPGSGFTLAFNRSDGDLGFGYTGGLDRTSGSYAIATITSANSEAIPIVSVALQGNAGTSATLVVAAVADTSASRARYGPRSLPSNYAPWPYLDANVAQSFCDAIVNAYQEPRATIDVTVNNATSQRLAQQLAREISDRVTVAEAQTGIDGDVFIERIRHTVREGGRFHTTVFSCERATDAGYGIWGTSTWGGCTWGF